MHVRGMRAAGHMQGCEGATACVRYYAKSTAVAEGSFSDASRLGSACVWSLGSTCALVSAASRRVDRRLDRQVGIGQCMDRLLCLGMVVGGRRLELHSLDDLRGMPRGWSFVVSIPRSWRSKT